MACNNNGKTELMSLTTFPGGTAANATYQIALEHQTCGNRKMCIQEVFPVTADLKFTVLGSPVSLDNGAFCCEVLCSGTVTYMPYVYGCTCNMCPRTENIYTTFPVPCSSLTVPTLTAGTAVATPTNVQPCCNTTNAISIITSLNVATGA